MLLEPIRYQAGGRTFTGWLADGSKNLPAPAILVVHEAGGLTGHVKEVAARLAGAGHVAFAMDLFGDAVIPPDPAHPETLARAQESARKLREDVSDLRSRMKAALAILESRPGVDGKRLAAVGYCLGGAAVIELARTGAPLMAIAGFHAGVLPGSAEDNSRIRGKVLLCHGDADPVVPVAQIRDFTADLSQAGVDWQLHLYGGVGHSFTNPEIDAWGFAGFAYDSVADARAWAALEQLLAEIG